MYFAWARCSWLIFYNFQLITHTMKVRTKADFFWAQNDCESYLLLFPLPDPLASTSSDSRSSFPLFFPFALFTSGGGSEKLAFGGGTENLLFFTSGSSRTRKCCLICSLKFPPALLYAGAKSLPLMRPPYSLTASANVSELMCLLVSFAFMWRIGRGRKFGTYADCYIFTFWNYNCKLWSSLTQGIQTLSYLILAYIT